MNIEPLVAPALQALILVALASACSAPPPPDAPPAPPLVSTPRPSARTSPAPPPSAPPSTEPAKPAAPPPRVSADAAREAAERAFARLQPTLPSGARLERVEGGPACANNACAWKWKTIVGTDSALGALDVDADTGAITYEPNDGRGGRFAIDAFVAREAEREKAVAAVAALAMVKAYCKKVQALQLGCLIYFEDGPSDEGCPASPPLESSCWNQVYVGEAHEGHSSRFGTFLVAPGTSRVAGAAGFCGPVPIAKFRGSGSGCPK